MDDISQDLNGPGPRGDEEIEAMRKALLGVVKMVFKEKEVTAPISTGMVEYLVRNSSKDFFESARVASILALQKKRQAEQESADQAPHEG